MLKILIKRFIMNKRQIIVSLNNIANSLDNSGLYKEANSITNVMIKVADEFREDYSPELDTRSESESFLDKMVVLPSYWGKYQEKPDEKQRLGDIFLENGKSFFYQAVGQARFDWFEKAMERLKNEILEYANFTGSQESDFLKYYEDFIESWWDHPIYGPRLEAIAKVDKFNPLFGSRKREV